MSKKKNALPLVLEIEQGPSGSWFWRLRASNNKVLGFSEMFSTHYMARRAAILVMDHMVPNTKLIDRRTDETKRL